MDEKPIPAAGHDAGPLVEAAYDSKRCCLQEVRMCWLIYSYLKYHYDYIYIKIYDDI